MLLDRLTSSQNKGITTAANLPALASLSAVDTVASI